MQTLIRRALAEGWSATLAREVDEYEIYLSAELERFEDMDPAHFSDLGAGQRLMEALSALCETLGDLREAAERGELAARAETLRAAVDAVGPLFE